MKKFLAFILALACALSLMACGKKNNDDKPDPDPAPDPQPTVTTAEFTHGYVDMKLELPEDDKELAALMAYVKAHNLKVLEGEEHV